MSWPEAIFYAITVICVSIVLLALLTVFRGRPW